jgi:hypothetical protein
VNFFGFCTFLISLLAFPFIFQTLYTAANSTVPGQFLSNQNDINASFSSYYMQMEEILLRFIAVSLQFFVEYTEIILSITLKLIDSVVHVLDAIATHKGGVALLCLLVTYGFVFQFSTVRQTCYEVTDPLVKAIQELWYSLKFSIIAIWESLNEAIVVALVAAFCFYLLQVGIKVL